MPCSAINVHKQPCGVSTKHRFCHIHAAKYVKLEKDLKLAHKVKKQTKELGAINIQMVEMKSKLIASEFEKDQASLESLRLKKEILMLKDLNSSLSEKNYSLKRQVKMSCIDSAKLLILSKRVLSLEDVNAQLESMKDDYDAYQTIRHFEYIHQQLLEMYGESNSINLIRSMKRDPKQAEIMLGYKPWKKYMRLKDERNALAHSL